MGRGSRRREIIASYRQLRSSRAVAEAVGVSDGYVRKVVAQSGESRSVGRPPFWPDCPLRLADDYAFLRQKARIPAPQARKMVLGSQSS